MRLPYKSFEKPEYLFFSQLPPSSVPASLYSIQLLPPSFVLTTPRASLYLIQLILLWSSFTLPRPRVACIRYSNSYCLSSFLNPNISMNLLNFGLGNGLVKILDTFSSVGTYLTCIFPSSTASRMKWYRRSMCFVLV